MKKNFTTGIALLLPIVFTTIIVRFLINFFTDPFLEITKNFLIHFSFFQTPHPFINSNILLITSSKILILLGLFTTILLIGLIGKLFLVNYFLKLGDLLLHRLPGINRIYKTSKEIIHTLFSSSSSSFSQVVLAPFPSPNARSIGLVTREALLIKKEGNESNSVIPVFIPGTPNPSVGFMLMFEKEKLIFTDMKVDDALKSVISCGVIMPNFTAFHFQEDYESPKPS